MKFALDGFASPFLSVTIFEDLLEEPEAFQSDRLLRDDVRAAQIVHAKAQQVGLDQLALFVPIMFYRRFERERAQHAPDDHGF